MGFIDEKGRLFGKINIIDFLIVIFLLSLAPMFYYGKVLLKKKVYVVKVAYPMLDLEVDADLLMVKPDELNLIKVGDKEIGPNGELLGEILWLGKARPYKYRLQFANDKTVVVSDQKFMEIPVKFRLKVTIKEDDFILYKNEQLKDQAKITFTTDKYILSARAFFYKEPEDRSRVPATVDINIILKGLDDATIKLISLGDKELDENGNVIAEILERGSVTKNKYDIFLDANVFTRAEEMGKKQLEVKMRLKGEIVNNKKLFFKGVEINDSSLLEFNPGKYAARGQISRIDNILAKEEKWVRVRVKFMEVIPELERVVKEGDFEKGPLGAKVAQIKTIIEKKSSEMMIITKDNQFINIPQSNKKDIIVSMDLLAEEKDGMLYYKKNTVKIGKVISFEADLYDLPGMIIAIER